MNTLIAGGAGFIGLNLAEAILRRGEHVAIYDPGAVPGAAQRSFDELPGSWCHIQESVIDSEALASTLTEQRIEQVSTVQLSLQVLNANVTHPKVCCR